MSIRRIIQDWLRKERFVSADQVTLVFHTSCVNFSEEDLRYLEQAGFRWSIPDNVRVELQLLLEDAAEFGPGAFSRRAEWILRRAKEDDMDGRTVDGRPWDLEQLYIGQNDRASIDRSTISGDILLFLFGERYKLNEFLEYARDMGGHYVLVLQRGQWGCADGAVANFAVEHNRLRMEARSFWSGRECLPVKKIERSEEKEQMRRIKISNGMGKILTKGAGMHGGELREPCGAGTYAKIHEAPRQIDDQLVKLYSGFTLVEEGIGKLRTLALCSEEVEHLPLAMPRLLLEWAPGLQQENLGVVGYTMKGLKGQEISLVPMAGWPDGVDGVQVMKRIGALLVEVHSRGMLVNDLSFHNVLMDTDGKVGFVDCDSFQIRGYPGGRITPIYRHRDVCEADCERVLRKPIHEYFAYAVLLYQLVMLVTDPLFISTDEKKAPLDWGNTEFPLDFDISRYDKASGEVLEQWCDQDERSRRLFADIFHFRKSMSIGAILRELGIV